MEIVHPSAMANDISLSVPSHDWGREAAVERTARHLRVLAELAEIGLDLARQIRQQAQASKWLGAEGAMMFSRIARAVRQTTALEARLAADAQRPDPKETREGPDATAPAPGPLAAPRPATSRDAGAGRVVARAVEDANEQAEEDASDAETDASDAERLLSDLHERLADPDIEAELGRRPIEAIVADICRDLGITPEISPSPAADLGFGEPSLDRGEAPPEKPAWLSGLRSSIAQRAATGSDPP